MNKLILRNKFWIITFLSLGFMLSCREAFAYEHGRHEYVRVGRDRYNYHDGRFYRPGWFGFELNIGAPPRGAVVSFLPFGYRSVIVAGTPYYYYEGIYYRNYPGGYIVVPQPVLASVSPRVESSVTITVNVPNSRGSYTPVILTKYNNGYIGPQGEFYPGHPTVEQLKALYGQ